MTQQKEFIPALGYNWLTAYYDLAIKLTMPEKKFRNKLIDFVNPKAGEKILEFGFGTGQNLVIGALKNSDTEFTGLDIYPKVKKIAQHRLKSKSLDIPLILYNGGGFPFKANTFDKVYSSLVFHQLDTEVKKHCLKDYICWV